MLPADLEGEALLRTMQATPSREYLLVEPDGSVYGVLVTADVDAAFTPLGLTRAHGRRPSPAPRLRAMPDAPVDVTDPTEQPRPPAPGPGSPADRCGRASGSGSPTRRAASTTSSSTAAKRFFANRGHVEHDELIGREEGFTVTSSGGAQYLVFRPLLNEYVVSMPRGAAVVYPKDAAQIVAMADIYPGAHVVEAGVGSGALTCSLLRAVGPTGRVSSYERREDFADVARRNVEQFFGGTHPAWRLEVGDLAEALPASTTDTRVDRVVLDMLAPWDCVDAVADALAPGGLVCAYVATTTQLSKTVETIRVHGGLHRAAPVGDAGARLARRGARRAPGPLDERPHRLPRHRPAHGTGGVPAHQATPARTRCLRRGLRGSPTRRRLTRDGDTPGRTDAKTVASRFLGTSRLRT